MDERLVFLKKIKLNNYFYRNAAKYQRIICNFANIKKGQILILCPSATLYPNNEANMVTLSTNRAKYKELMKNPLIFLHKVEHSDRDNDGRIRDYYTWESVDDDFTGSSPERDFDGNGFGSELVVAEQIQESNSDSGTNENDTISFPIHAVNGSRQDDWRLVINSFIIRSHNHQDDRYPYIHLLWLLNFAQWNSDTIIQALRIYDVHSQSFVINNALCRVSRCLSESKQFQMKTALAAYNVTYEVYIPQFLAEAYYKLSPRPEYDRGKIDLNRLVDLILEAGDKEDSPRLSFEENTNNPFLNVYRWLHNSEISVDYSILNSVFALAPHKIQKRIVQRYFHDIRLGRTSLDLQLLEQFKNNDFSDFIRYRYCLQHPGEPVNLSVPFLCDSILTLIQTNGESFQSFNGILDFAMTHCDVTKPTITLGMKEFLPQCDGGAVYNSGFKGFIDYSVVCELDESKFTQEKLLASIRRMLDTRPHESYYGCRFDDEKKPFTEEQARHCFSQRTIEIDSENGRLTRTENRCSSYTTYQYENKWKVLSTDYTWVNIFLREPLPQVESNSQVIPYTIDIEQTSTSKIENYIRFLANQCERDGENAFIIKSKDMKALSLLLQYSKPVSMRIYPQSLPIIGMNFDVFGIKRNLCLEHNVGSYSLSNEMKDEFKKQEAAEVNRRVVEALKRELNINEYNGVFFEIPYDKELLRRLIAIFYYKGTISDNPADSEIEFLRRQDRGRYAAFCAPKLAEVHNMATDLPFFWCLGKECFHNNLAHQTLEECPSWKDYSLYHMIEIIGLQKIKSTEAGYEPDDVVKKFIGCANKVSKEFRRLKCKNCGHLLYTSRRNYHAIYNYFSCINPTCPEHDNPIYLSYCYKCKKGLIDSRDSVQCPNGWYICPTCHSCCDDDQYERQAQRYISQNRVVPAHIEIKRGHGHNDKGIYFCHICGTELQMFGERGNEKWGCPHCQKEYNRNIDNNYYWDFQQN